MNIKVIMLDADGALFNRRYSRLLIALINKFKDEINDYACIIKDMNVPVSFHGNFVKKVQTFLKENKDYLDKVKLRPDIIEGYKSENLANDKLKSIVLFDYIKKLSAIDEGILAAVLYMSNIELVKNLIEEANKPDQQLVLMLGSNRGSYGHDLAGRWENGTDSIYNALRQLKEIIELNLVSEKKCHLSYFCLSDIYSDMPHGHSFKKNLKTLRGEGGDENDANFVYDKVKLNLIYGAAHHACSDLMSELNIKLQSDDNIEIEFYDDLKLIHDGLTGYLAEREELLPSIHNFKLKLIEYKGVIGTIREIRGAGPLDLNYRENLKCMTKMCGHDLKSELSINSVKALDAKLFLSRRRLMPELMMLSSSSMVLFQPRCSNSNSKVLSLLLDADGCIYNKMYRCLLMHLVTLHWSFIKESLDKDLISHDYREHVLNPTLSNMIKEALDLSKTEDVTALEDDLIDSVDAVNDLISLLNQLGEGGQRVMREILYLANKPLFDQVIYRMNNEKFDELLLVSLSSRQSFDMDEYNARCNGTGFFFQDLYLLREKFESLLGQKILCTYNDISMASLYKKYIDNVGHAVFDETKFTLWYGLTNHLLHHHAHEKMTFAFYDDRDDIRAALLHMILLHRDLIHQTDFEFWGYDGCPLPDDEEAIINIDENHIKLFADFKQYPIDLKSAAFHVVGKGVKDQHYGEHVYMMARLCQGNRAEQLQSNKSIDAGISFTTDEKLMEDFSTLKKEIVASNKVLQKQEISFKKC